MIPKDALLEILRKETATTLKVLRAFPTDQVAFKPHDRSNDAKQLMKTFVFEMYLNKAYLFGEQMNPDKFKTYDPESADVAIADFEREALECIDKLEELPEEKLSETIEFGGKTFTKDMFLEMMVHDQIHHRGQLSVYIRMAGGKVPSIYGPSADDPSTNL